MAASGARRPQQRFVRRPHGAAHGEQGRTVCRARSSRRPPALCLAHSPPSRVCSPLTATFRAAASPFPGSSQASVSEESLTIRCCPSLVMPQPSLSGVFTSVACSKSAAQACVRWHVGWHVTQRNERAAQVWDDSLRHALALAGQGVRADVALGLPPAAPLRSAHLPRGSSRRGATATSAGTACGTRGEHMQRAQIDAAATASKQRTAASAAPETLVLCLVWVARLSKGACS